MKFYSEKLNQIFDTPEELQAAEAATKSTVKKKKAAATPAEKPVESPEAITRKQLAADVESAEQSVKAAYADYEAAKVKAEELSKQYLAQVDAILEPAKKAIKDAEQKRYQAIKNFNEKFGAYQVTYTGARAADEMIKAMNSINSQANRIFRDMFWI